MSTRILGCVALSLLTGCSIVIDQPKDAGPAVSNPVIVAVHINGKDCGVFRATLDSNDATSLFGGANFLSSGQGTASLGSLSPGTHSLTVSDVVGYADGSGCNGNGASTATSSFSIFGISSESPSPVNRGATISLTGSNFDASCPNDHLTIGGVPATATNCNSTSLKFVVPPGTPPGPSIPIVLTVGQGSAQLSAQIGVTVNPTQIVAAGGPNSAQVGVIDFTDTANPKVKVFNAGFTGGVVVDCSGTKMVVGDSSMGGTGKVLVFDITDPANPVQKASLATNFTQLGAIKFDGTRILVGDMNGFQVAMLKFDAATNSLSLITMPPPTTHESAITSVGLSGSLGVVAATLSQTMDVFRGIPANPTGTISLTPQQFSPANGLGLSADLSGTLAAVGSKGSGSVKLFDVSGNPPTLQGTTSTTQGSIDSVSISGKLVAVGSNNNSSGFLINFGTSPPKISNPISPMVSGQTVNLNGSHLVIGGVNNANISLFDVSIDSTGKPVASPVKSVNVTSTGSGGVNSIGTACFTTF